MKDTERENETIDCSIFFGMMIAFICLVHSMFSSLALLMITVVMVIVTLIIIFNHQEPPEDENYPRKVMFYTALINTAGFFIISMYAATTHSSILPLAAFGFVVTGVGAIIARPKSPVRETTYYRTYE